MGLLNGIAVVWGVSAGEVVSILVGALSSVIGLIAAVAAWRAASASKQSVFEMVKARNQYARPVLVFGGMDSFHIDLADTEHGRSLLSQVRDARVSLRNVGKGAAYDLSCTWISNAGVALAKSEIDVEGVNRLLASADLVVSWSAENDSKKLEVRKKSSGERQSVIPLAAVVHTRRCAHLDEKEDFTIQVPSEGIFAHILLSLNQLAREHSRGAVDSAYGYFPRGEYSVTDSISIATKSITDERVFYELEGSFSGGCYTSRLDGGKASMLAIVSHDWSEQVV